jgi:uncharacterized glyoxalase superfamily protein PhnB
MAVKPIPEGYSTATPYLVVPNAAKVLEFVKKAFGAKESYPAMTAPDGSIMHAEVTIGDSRIMMGQSSERWPPIPAMLYLYVPDCDAVYKSAVAAGGTSVTEPANQFYGDRHGTVRDAGGNLWCIATHVEDVPPEEMATRAAAAMKQGH